jgi:hypothetical protein
MLFAKLALGFCGTAAVAGAYTFHEGVMRVDVDEANHRGTHVHVWVPAAVVPMALHLVPSQHLESALHDAGPWMPTLRALTKELRRYPETELVEVRDHGDHVRIRTHQGKLLIDVSEPNEEVHVACPLAMMEDVARELEARAPGA